MTAQLSEIRLDRIHLSQTESQKARRASFDKAGLAELAASVKADGVVVPIIVRSLKVRSTQGLNGLRVGDKDFFSPQKAEEYARDNYELIAGERRYLAATQAELETIPAVVRDLTDAQAVAVQLIENLQRVDLHPMHEAESYHELVHKFGHELDDVIAQVGKSRSYVYSRMKLLALAPECRKAFYASKISASVALLLARIPVESTQKEALKAVTRDDWSYRRAAEIVRDNFMLKLAEAAFPVTVALAGAGPCGACPKRTGNAPELFDDVKSADVCTDPVCFAAKTRAHSQQLVQQARDRGQPVLTGKAADKVVPGGVHSGRTHVTGGFVAADGTHWVGNREKKVSAIVGKTVERTLVVDDETGRTIEVVPESAVRKALGERASSSASSGVSAAEKKAKLEKRVTFATYAAVRSKLKPPSLFEIAAALFRRLEHDATKILCKVRGFEPPTRKEQYRGKVVEYAAVGAGLDKMTDAELQLFINDCIYVRELMDGHSQYRGELGIPKIAELATRHRVDVAAIRRDVEPKKPKKPKKPKMKAAGKKKAAKKEAGEKPPKAKPLHERRGMAAVLKRNGLKP